jgi:predicted ATPase
MITKLEIQNFKSHKKTSLAMGPLTLLSGVNSSGKSSILQSLLLLRQSQKIGRLAAGLDLNGSLCSIGVEKDVLCRFAKDDIISFLLIDENKTFKFQFKASSNTLDATFMPCCSDLNVSETQGLSLFSNNFQYISAVRLAGLDSYPVDTYAVETENQISKEKGQAELVAHFLDYYGNENKVNLKSIKVEKKLLHQKNNSRNLLQQVIAWEAEISPRVTINLERNEKEVKIKYGYRGKHSLQDLRASNIGFGVSYSLPIVVALLSAKPGALILLENPEAHLHPKGQSKLVELMARAAESGIQVVVETHSDHIFNGILKAVTEGTLDKNNAKVHYCELNRLNISKNTEIKFMEGGRIINPRPGFFDQFDEDLDAMLGLRPRGET